MTKLTQNGLIIIAIVYVVTNLLQYLLVPLYTMKLTPAEYNSHLPENLLLFIRISLPFIFNIAVGIFLFKEAKRENQVPILWFFLGCVFKFWAILLFYIFPRIKKLNQKAENNHVI